MEKLKLSFLILFSSMVVIARASEFTMQDIAKHSNVKDCWILIDSKVYDITKYIPRHPSPENVLTKYCGKDAKVGWETKDHGKTHSRIAQRLLKQFEVGVLK